MGVKMIGKEMDFEGNTPSNDAPVPPTPMPQQQPVDDHTHDEMDAMMVKLQELEGRIDNKELGGINQESLDEGKPENDKGKPTGGQKHLSDNQGNFEPKKIERIIRKVIEELKGIPERDTGKDLNKSGPENTDNIPLTKQPAVGKAPSGGGFDSDDKTNKEDGDETVTKINKPASDYDKTVIKKNKMDRAKVLIEKAKQLMREANDPDPSEPQPGKVINQPKQMDGQATNKSPLGGTEEFEGGLPKEDPNANIPNDKRPVMKEQDENDEDDEDDENDEPLKEIFNNLRKELKQERISKRESLVGLSSLSNEQSNLSQEEFITHKENVSKTIKEYLLKAGHGRALGLMTS